MSNHRHGSWPEHNGKKVILETLPGSVQYQHSTQSGLALKVYTDIQSTNGSGACTFTVPAGMFAAIVFVNAVVLRNSTVGAGVAAPDATFAAIRSFTTTQVVVQCYESKQTGMLIGGVAEGLETSSQSLALMLMCLGT